MVAMDGMRLTWPKECCTKESLADARGGMERDSGGDSVLLDGGLVQECKEQVTGGIR